MFNVRNVNGMNVRYRVWDLVFKKKNARVQYSEQIVKRISKINQNGRSLSMYSNHNGISRYLFNIDNGFFYMMMSVMMVFFEIVSPATTTAASAEIATAISFIPNATFFVFLIAN